MEDCGLGCSIAGACWSQVLNIAINVLLGALQFIGFVVSDGSSSSFSSIFKSLRSIASSLTKDTFQFFFTVAKKQFLKYGEKKLEAAAYKLAKISCRWSA